MMKFEEDEKKGKATISLRFPVGKKKSDLLPAAEKQLQSTLI